MESYLGVLTWFGLFRMSEQPFRSFAVVPAAGVSRRMGENKLLLPCQGTTLIEHVLSEWASSNVDATVVVLHPANRGLVARCRAGGAHCVLLPSASVEMKHSVQVALQWIDQHLTPLPDDAWLLAPADMPRLSHSVIDQMISSYDPAAPAIVVPRHGPRRGHPTLFPWSVRSAVDGLGPDEGINSLLDHSPVVEIITEDPGILEDVDTPEDYQRFKRQS